MSGRIALIGGGVRSGKSAFALLRARELGARRVLLATAEARDPEMRDRIARHRRERGADFGTVEEPLALAAALRGLRDADVAVVDCLTLWLSNLLLRDESEARVLAHVDELCSLLAERRRSVVIVTSEVGMGVVPESALGRAFRDLAGLAHQRIARCADEIYLAALGCVVRLRPAPVELQAVGGAHDGPA
jgi:adenosylcobinamide kinase/adenosylcobinamide-phosphate guanylyltransferase